MQSTKPEFKRDNKTVADLVSAGFFAVGSIYFVARCGGKAWYELPRQISGKIQKTKGGKFLKKLWCCVGGKYCTRDNFVLSHNANWPPQRDSKADVSTVSPSSEC